MRSVLFAGGLALLDASYAAWRDGVRTLDLAALARPVGELEGEWAAHPMVELVLHINREAIHHLAEVALLRDLYRERDGLGHVPHEGREVLR